MKYYTNGFKGFIKLSENFYTRIFIISEVFCLIFIINLKSQSECKLEINF